LLKHLLSQTVASTAGQDGQVGWKMNATAVSRQLEEHFVMGKLFFFSEMGSPETT
jgi:hypothetical protein